MPAASVASSNVPSPRLRKRRSPPLGMIRGPGGRAPPGRDRRRASRRRRSRAGRCRRPSSRDLPLEGRAGLIGEAEPGGLGVVDEVVPRAGRPGARVRTPAATRLGRAEVGKQSAEGGARRGPALSGRDPIQGGPGLGVVGIAARSERPPAPRLEPAAEGLRPPGQGHRVGDRVGLEEAEGVTGLDLVELCPAARSRAASSASPARTVRPTSRSKAWM